MNRGEIYRVRRPPGRDPKRSRCFVVVSRQGLIDSKAARVVCAPINTTCAGLTTQAPVGIDEGLRHPSLDQVVLTDFVAVLSAPKLRQLRTALRIAVAVE